MSRVKVCPLYNLMPALHQESLLDYVQKYSLQLQSDCPTACKTMLTLLNHLPNQVIGAQGTCSVLFSSDLQQKVTSLFFVLFFVCLFFNINFISRGDQRLISFRRDWTVELHTLCAHISYLFIFHRTVICCAR